MRELIHPAGGLVTLLKKIEADAPGWEKGLEEASTAMKDRYPNLYMEFGKAKNGEPYAEVWRRMPKRYLLSVESVCGIFKVEDMYL